MVDVHSWSLFFRVNQMADCSLEFSWSSPATHQEQMWWCSVVSVWGDFVFMITTYCAFLFMTSTMLRVIVNCCMYLSETYACILFSGRSYYMFFFFFFGNPIIEKKTKASSAPFMHKLFLVYRDVCAYNSHSAF